MPSPQRWWNKVQWWYVVAGLPVHLVGRYMQREAPDEAGLAYVLIVAGAIAAVWGFSPLLMAKQQPKQPGSGASS